MTSKEALETLFDVACNREHTNSEHSFWLKAYRVIKKDLEVLEILKHILLGIEATFNQKAFNESGVFGTIIKDYFINNDITGKVKEWLENEK